MNHLNNTPSIIENVLYNLSGDTMLLSDKLRIASFLETTRRSINKNNKLKNNN
jgi:hypothetical protein